MKKLTNIISNTLAENGSISTNDIEVCNYGLELFITSVLEIAAILIISLFVGNFLETVIFFAGFLPIRIYSGGYHADTRIRCFIILIVVYTLFSIIISFDMFNIYKYIMIPMSILTLLCVYTWAPLHHKNKFINIKEKIKFKNISTLLTLVETCLIVLLIFTNIYNKYSISLFLSLLTVFFSLFTGKIKEFMQRRDKNEKNIE